MSLGSKHDDTNEFYLLLNAFIKTHEASFTEIKNQNNRVLNNVNQLCNDYFDLYKKNYDNANVRNGEKRGCDYKQFKIIYNRDQEPKSTKKEGTKTKKPDEIQKPLWIKLNKNDFDSLIEDVYNSLNNNEFKTTVDKKAYDLKNAKKFLVKVTTQKNSEKKALKLYSDLIILDITALEESNGKAKDK